MDNDEQHFGEKVGCPTQTSNVDHLEWVAVEVLVDLCLDEMVHRNLLCDLKL
jgi:hypothetical protein